MYVFIFALSSLLTSSWAAGSQPGDMLNSAVLVLVAVSLFVLKQMTSELHTNAAEWTEKKNIKIHENTITDKIYAPEKSCVWIKVRGH